MKKERKSSWLIYLYMGLTLGQYFKFHPRYRVANTHINPFDPALN